MKRFIILDYVSFNKEADEIIINGYEEIGDLEDLRRLRLTNWDGDIARHGWVEVRGYKNFRQALVIDTEHKYYLEPNKMTTVDNFSAFHIAAGKWIKSERLRKKTKEYIDKL